MLFLTSMKGPSAHHSGVSTAKQEGSYRIQWKEASATSQLNQTMNERLLTSNTLERIRQLDASSVTVSQIPSLHSENRLT